MIEIGAQVDLFHPARRVWQTVTDPELLARWFTEAEVVPGAQGRLLLHTAGLDGFDAAVEAEVLDRLAPELITLRCQEGDRRSQLTCEILPTVEGTRLSVREVLEHGTWSPDQRDRRERCYEQALTGRLPAILDWLAFQQVDLGRTEAGMTAELPVAEEAGDGPDNRGRRRLLLVAALTGVAVAAAGTAWAVWPAESAQTAAQAPASPSPSATPEPAATSRSPRPNASSRPAPDASATTGRPRRSPTPAPSRTLPATPSAGPVLAARYETVSTRLLAYTGRVVVDNPGGTDSRPWTLVVTLSDGDTVSDVRGADWRQDGQTVTFTGPALAAGRSQTVRFDVRDAASLTKGPESCTIDGNPCEGL